MKLFSFFILIFMLVTVVPKSAFGAGQASWESSGWTQLHTKDGLIRTFLAQKTLHPNRKFGDISILEATLTLHELPIGPIAKLSSAEMAEQFRSLLQLPEFTVTQVDNYAIYEAPYKSQNKYIRIFIKKEKTRVLISIAAARSLFAFPSLSEAELLQKSWFANDKIKEVSKLDLILKAAIPPANAALSLGNMGTDFSLVAGKVSSFGISLGSGVSQVNSAINGASRSVNGATAGLNNVAGGLNSVTAFHNDLIAGLGVSAGMVVGTSFATLVMNGISSGLSDLYHIISGTVSDAREKELINNAKSAADTLKTQSEALMNVEKAVNLQMAALAFSACTNPENLAAGISSDLALQEAELDDISAKLREQNDRETKICLLKQRDAVVQITEFENQMKQNISGMSYKDICSNIEAGLGNWVSIENQMSNAKTVLVNEMSAIASQQMSEAKKTLRSAQDKEDAHNACIAEAKGLSEELAAYGTKNSREDLLEICNSANSVADHVNMNEIANRNLERLKKSTANLLTLQKQLVGSECRVGQRDKTCDGTQGSFDQIRERYEKLGKLQNQFCSNDKISAPKDQNFCAEVGEGYRNSLGKGEGSTPPSISEAPAPPADPIKSQGADKDSASPSWLSSLGHWVAKATGSFFGWFRNQFT